MKERTKILQYSVFCCAILFLIGTICIGVRIFRNNQLEYHAINNLEAATIVLANMITLVDTTKKLYEAESEKSKSINELPKASLIPNLILSERINISRLCISKMCEMQLQFDDMKIDLTRIKSHHRFIGLERLISLAELLSNYCKEYARADDLWINNKQYDSLLLAKLHARINKEINALGAEIGEITIKVKQSLSDERKQNFKCVVAQKFKAEIDKYSDQCSKLNDPSKICMYIFEWPIINMCLYA